VAVLKNQTKGPSTAVFLAVIAALVAVVVAVVAIGAVLFDPFATETIDRSGPALLQRIRKLEEFNAAEGNFVQSVDLQEDAAYLPDFLKGQRVTALVTGKVRATVDFSQLGDKAVEVGNDGRSITLTLPEPVLQPAEIDEAGTRVVSRDRGLIDRIGELFSGNPFDDRKLYVAAQKKLNTAASESDLQQTAKENTEAWLKTFLSAAGFEDITINWSKAPT